MRKCARCGSTSHECYNDAPFPCWDTCKGCGAMDRRPCDYRCPLHGEMTVPSEEETPTQCECDNTHDQNHTCCRFCWAQGYRNTAHHEIKRLGSLHRMQREVHALSVEKGWWEGVQQDPEGRYHPSVSQLMERMALLHSEVAEASEDIRTGDMTVRVNEKGKPEGFPTELVDMFIRGMDLAEALGIDLELEIARKHAFNKTRSYRHGGKRA